MSMPSFPPNGADMTREEALTMIIASIAMEELALSHILNAEGEKLQYILGTLHGTSHCACPQDVLAVNKSVASLAVEKQAGKGAGVLPASSTALQAGAGSLSSAVFLPVTAPRALSCALSSPTQDADL